MAHLECNVAQIGCDVVQLERNVTHLACNMNQLGCDVGQLVALL